MQFLHNIPATGGNLIYAWFEAMHTRMDMLFCSQSMTKEELLDVAQAVKDKVAGIEAMASCFLAGSELSAVNTSPRGQAVPVSPELLHILSECLRYNESTDGVFDVSASHGAAGKRLKDKIVLDMDYASVTRLSDDVYLNLSGYLKGYALDRAVQLARDAGVCDALINFGNSSVYAIGNHPGGKGWPVAAGDDEAEKYVLTDQCLTTSGNSTQTRRHIVDPTTGRYMEGKGSFSVVTDSAAEGEVMATVGFISMCKKKEAR